ncbi:uncharacterized protein [Misgurnus anguillicaudatus]|uniref:uncharacterized protein n=1 Tax=Misgurnus anguillicaudatus TaxID=75329 RepID=UPI0024357C08|nr:uncharacterized protein si:ch211-175m2.4 [Misgurnus anguillicaudatus]XP_055034572.1 uncharacterized protein si:ch211-175m2.4 [Misgurnus anguillicaudatus]
MIAYPVYQQQPYQVTEFLKNKPQIFGLLELLVALVMISFIIWDKYLPFLVTPAFFTLSGIFIFVASCTEKLCLVKTAQAFNYMNMVVVAISFRFHLVFTARITLIVLLVCDALVLILSIAIVAMSCRCCCKSKSREIAVSYVTSGMPVNNAVQMNQLDPSAAPQNVTSVVYVLPAGCEIPSVPPLQYGTVASAPPGYYSLVPTAPPPAYEQVAAFPPPEQRT